LRHKRPFSWDLRLQVEDAHTLRVVRCSKRVVQVGQNIAWGWSGMVCVRGHGQTTKEMEARLLTSAQRSRGDIGCLFSDNEFEILIAHLTSSDVSLLKQPLRSNLDFVRELVVKSVLFESQKPSRRAIHEALKIVGNRLRSFLNATVDLDEPAIRDLESNKIPVLVMRQHFRYFCRYPDRYARSQPAQDR
jgi:hypothetical protein